MTICFQRKKWVLHVLKKCVDLCWICAAVKFCLIGPVALCCSPAPVNLSWNFAEFTAITCALINGVPIFRFHASVWVCLLSIGVHGTSSAWQPQCLLASWQVFWQGAAAANTTFCLLVKLDHCRSISFGSRECWRFLQKRSGSEPWEHFCERQGQTEGRVPKSYVTLDKSRLRSCDNEVRVVHRSNHFLGWVFFFLFWFLFCFGFCFVVCLWFLGFFLSYSVSILSKFRKEVSPNKHGSENIISWRPS